MDGRHSDVLGVPSSRVSDVHGISDGLSTARPSFASGARTPRGGAMHFEEGDVVWTPSTKHGFRTSTIVSIQNDSYIVETRDDENPAAGGQSTVRRDEVRPFFDYGPEKTWADNTAMVHLDDANILDNIRRRYHRDEIYTYTANVLLAVNPYKSLPGMYSQEKVGEYRNKSLGSMPPHPYSIADTAYRHLLRQRQNQALVISGESGAGKTETAKVTMHYLTQVSRTDAAVGGQIQERIINSNPILESFGNASTVRNQNSSRFGKYNEMFFNPVGSLMYAGIRTYLLESSRVVQQQQGERNFHVFYEMLAGLNEEYLEETLQLDASGYYRLLHGGGAPRLVPGSPEALREKRKFEELTKAMGTFVSPEEHKEFWELVAALIHLGEVQFMEIGGGASGGGGGDCTPVRQHGSISMSPLEGSPTSQATTEAGGGDAKVQVHPDSTDSLTQAAFLLGILQGGLEQALIYKEMNVKGRSTIFCPRTHQQAVQTQQSIIKILYKRLFDKIVERINETSAGKADMCAGQESRYSSIGTLDIYGFERLGTNSFEQLCINLANERLQQFFIEEVLEAEQRVYEEEGLRIQRFPLPNNQPVVVGIQSVMGILDEHSLRSSRGLVREGAEADMKFCEHVHRNLIEGRRESPIMSLRMNAKAAREGTAMKANEGFQVRHYAGDVTYQTKGWIDKNNDALVPEVESLLDDSNRALVRGMADRNRMQAASTKDSVSHKYLGNLNELLATLKQCSVHYIRCFNPNDNKEAGTFFNQCVLEQVIQCGTVELVKIMHHGFPNRCFLKDLRERFASLLPPDFERYKDGEFMEAVMLAFEIDQCEWTLGNRRLFLKAGQLLVLESLLEQGGGVPQDLLRRIRLHFAKRKLRSIVAKAKVLRMWLRSNRKNRVRTLVTHLSKAIFIYVRSMRWLAKTRARISPPQPEAAAVAAAPEPEVAPVAVPAVVAPVAPPSPPPRCQEELELFNLTAVRVIKQSTQQMFVACNTWEQPAYSNFFASDMDMRKPIGDTTLKMWQRDSTENILYHDGKDVVCARLDPKAFVLGELTDPRTAGLDDVRLVDVHMSGQAFPLNSLPREYEMPAITCMCQDRANRRDFATCDDNKMVSVWRWLGTDAAEPQKFATKVVSGCLPGFDEIHAMCFLSEDVLPRRITDKSGKGLAMLLSQNGQLTIMVCTMYQGSHHIECIVAVDVPLDDVVPVAQSDGSRPVQDVEICFFTTTHSERLLTLGGGVVGGHAIFRLFEVQVDAQENLRLVLVEDPETKEQPIECFLGTPGLCITSLLNLPKPNLIPGEYDWLIFGDNKGTLYGFKLNHLDGGRYEAEDRASGRFRRSTHTEGVAIKHLVGCYGEEHNSHHKEVQRSCLPYSVFMNKVALSNKTFYSLGEDGILLTWNLHSDGWRCSSNSHFQREDVVSTHCSRLVPNILVRYDKASGSFQCHDTAKNRQARNSVAGGA